MYAAERAILICVQSSPEQRLVGRTLLQKTLYLLNLMLDLGIRYRPHYYGPYSDEVARATASLVALGALREGVESFPADEGPHEPRRYSYELTELGSYVLDREPDPVVDERLRNACKAIWKQSVDYNELAAASKLYHIARQHGGQISYDQVREKAQELGWGLSETQIEKAVALLVDLFGGGK